MSPDSYERAVVSPEIKDAGDCCGAIGWKGPLPDKASATTLSELDEGSLFWGTQAGQVPILLDLDTTDAKGSFRDTITRFAATRIENDQVIGLSAVEEAPERQQAEFEAIGLPPRGSLGERPGLNSVARGSVDEGRRGQEGLHRLFGCGENLPGRPEHGLVSIPEDDGRARLEKTPALGLAELRDLGLLEHLSRRGIPLLDPAFGAQDECLAFVGPCQGLDELS